MNDPVTLSICKHCGLDIWWDETLNTWKHDEHEGETCGFVSPDTVAEPGVWRSYPVEFPKSGLVKIIAPAGDHGTPIELTIDTSKLDSTQVIEITPEGQITMTSDKPFIEIPSHVRPEDEDDYVALMTEKYEASRAEFLREMHDDD